MEEWKEYKANDFCLKVTDGTHDSPKPKANGEHYLITSKHLKSGRIDFTSAYKISEEDYQKVIERSKVEKFDILFSMIGTIGNIYRESSDDIEYAVKNMAIFKCGGDSVKSSWLYYWLQSPKAKEYINSRLTGSTQGYLTLETLRNFPIDFPSFQTAKKIVSLLSSFDDKIEVNKKINSNLEEQAKALFKSWFIDFEPFKDGKFVDSELGKIPEGWKVTTIGDVTENIKEKVGNRNDIKVLSPITSGQLVLSEDYFSKQVFSNSIAKYIVVNHNDFAYNPARINIGSIGMNEFEFDGCVSPVYVVFRCQTGYEYFFDLYRRTSYFTEEVKKRAIGGVRQTLSYKDLSLIQLIYPPKKVVDAFNFIFIGFIQEIHSNDVSNKKLEAIRDTLLPKLMSGEIEVK